MIASASKARFSQAYGFAAATFEKDDHSALDSRSASRGVCPQCAAVAAAGGLYRLPRALPKAIALELIVTGAHFDARRAYHHGLVNRLVARDQLMPEALRLANAICENAPIAVRESLSVARQALDLDDAALRDLSAAAARKVAATEDYKEGPRAFIEKRAPRWVGR